MAGALDLLSLLGGMSSAKDSVSALGSKASASDDQVTQALLKALNVLQDTMVHMDAMIWALF